MYHAYDSVYIYAHALESLINNNLPVNGDNLNAAIRAVSFIGTTGLVELNSLGDRYAAYDIVGFHDDGIYQIWGTWSEQDQKLIKTDNPIFYDGTINIPLDTPARETKYISSSLTIAMIVIMGLLMAISIGFHLFVAAYSNHRVIKSSNVMLMQLMLLGSIIAYMYGVIAGLGYEHRITCIFPYILICIGFDFIFGALLTKTLIIHEIFVIRIQIDIF
jgi:hypothetical protein